MKKNRREFLKLAAALSQFSLWAPTFAQASQTKPVSAARENIYDIPSFGDASLLHFTDCHAQLLPIYFREPDTNLGVGDFMYDTVPHIVGKHVLDRFDILHKSQLAYALTYLDFDQLSNKYGAMGGFAYLSSLVKQLKDSRPGSLLLDGGDTWQGSATSMWTNAQDMVDAALLLGVDIMTGHWEFTYGSDRLMHVLENDFQGKIDFIAQNVRDNEFEDPVFSPYVIREINNHPIAIIGQAFPYTRIAHPKYLSEGWQFGLQEENLQAQIGEVKEQGVHAVVLLSHNGMDVDLKLASQVSGLDFILGGHTHDAIPIGVPVKNPGGQTIVMNSGTNGKFISVLDMKFKNNKLSDFRSHLLPIFSNLLKPEPEMVKYISNVRKPFLEKLHQPLAVNKGTLYRRGTFNGTFDQLIVDALIERQDAEIAFSPGFRWGTTILPGETITTEHVMAQTAITYPMVTRNEITGAQIKEILEDLADNRFNPNPYYQQGGDMVRVGGLSYNIDLSAKIGSRIQDMRLDGKPIMPKRKYVVAGWASVNKIEKGVPIWSLVSDYLKDKKNVSVSKLNIPKLLNYRPGKGMY